MRRTGTTYDPASTTPFRISRSKVEDFLRCRRCFYLDRRLGVRRPSTPPFTLNNAVDTLLKREFDEYRHAGEPHPLMVQAGIDAVPFQHPLMEAWRDALRRGITFVHPPTNLLLTGGVDDVWVTPAKELIVVDYKATAKQEEVNLDAEWQVSYKRQVEFYQWLLRRNGFTVLSTAWFVYCNGNLDRPGFDRHIDFSITLLPHEGNDAWVEGTVADIHACLRSDELPASAKGCEYCEYRASAQEHEGV